MENIINVQSRTGAGKGFARKIRATKRIPAICYGKNFETPIPISVDYKELAKTIRTSSATSLFTLKSDQKSLDGQKALIKSKQVHPLTDEVIHVDLLVVKMGEKIKVSVPVELTGKAKGVAEGGILQQMNRTLNIRCLPDNIPTKIVVDVSHLDLNDSIHVSDIKLPEGAVVVGSVDYTLAVVVPPEKEEVAVVTPEAAAAAAAVQPEVTAQKSEGKDAAAGAPAADAKPAAGDKKPAEKKEPKK